MATKIIFRENGETRYVKDGNRMKKFTDGLESVIQTVQSSYSGMSYGLMTITYDPSLISPIRAWSDVMDHSGKILEILSQNSSHCICTIEPHTGDDLFLSIPTSINSKNHKSRRVEIERSLLSEYGGQEINRVLPASCILKYIEEQIEKGYNKINTSHVSGNKHGYPHLHIAIYFETSNIMFKSFEELLVERLEKTILDVINIHTSSNKRRKFDTITYRGNHIDNDVKILGYIFKNVSRGSHEKLLDCKSFVFSEGVPTVLRNYISCHFKSSGGRKCMRNDVLNLDNGIVDKVGVTIEPKNSDVFNSYIYHINEYLRTNNMRINTFTPELSIYKKVEGTNTYEFEESFSGFINRLEIIIPHHRGYLPLSRISNFITSNCNLFRTIYLTFTYVEFEDCIFSIERRQKYEKKELIYSFKYFPYPIGSFKNKSQKYLKMIDIFCKSSDNLYEIHLSNVISAIYHVISPGYSKLPIALCDSFAVEKMMNPILNLLWPVSQVENVSTEKDYDQKMSGKKSIVNFNKMFVSQIETFNLCKLFASFEKSGQGIRTRFIFVDDNYNHEEDCISNFTHNSRLKMQPSVRTKSFFIANKMILYDKQKIKMLTKEEQKLLKELEELSPEEWSRRLQPEVGGLIAFVCANMNDPPGLPWATEEDVQEIYAKSNPLYVNEENMAIFSKKMEKYFSGIEEESELNETGVSEISESGESVIDEITEYVRNNFTLSNKDVSVTASDIRKCFITKYMHVNGVSKNKVPNYSIADFKVAIESIYGKPKKCRWNIQLK